MALMLNYFYKRRRESVKKYEIKKIRLQEILLLRICFWLSYLFLFNFHEQKFPSFLLLIYFLCASSDGQNVQAIEVQISETTLQYNVLMHLLDFTNYQMILNFVYVKTIGIYILTFS